MQIPNGKFVGKNQWNLSCFQFGIELVKLNILVFPQWFTLNSVTERSEIYKVLLSDQSCSNKRLNQSTAKLPVISVDHNSSISKVYSLYSWKTSLSHKVCVLSITNISRVCPYLFHSWPSSLSKITTSSTIIITDGLVNREEDSLRVVHDGMLN